MKINIQWKINRLHRNLCGNGLLLAPQLSFEPIFRFKARVDTEQKKLHPKIN